MQDERLLDAQEQAEQLGGILELEYQTQGRVRIKKMKLPEWAGERQEFFDILVHISDNFQFSMAIDAKQAISSGERKIALAELYDAGFVEDVMASDLKITRGEMVRLPVPVYTPDPVF